MTRPSKMTLSEVSNHLETLPNWSICDGREAIQRQFKFQSFAQAIDFMVRIAPIADELDHHPEWSNVYNKVDVILTTHDVGGVTHLDIDLAEEMETAFKT